MIKSRFGNFHFEFGEHLRVFVNFILQIMPLLDSSCTWRFPGIFLVLSEGFI